MAWSSNFTSLMALILEIQLLRLEKTRFPHLKLLGRPSSDSSFNIKSQNSIENPWKCKKTITIDTRRRRAIKAEPLCAKKTQKTRQLALNWQLIWWSSNIDTNDIWIIHKAIYDFNGNDRGSWLQFSSNSRFLQI